MKYAYIFILIALITLGGCESKNDEQEEKQNKNLIAEETTEPPEQKKMTEHPKQEETTAPEKQDENILLAESVTNIIDKSQNRVSNIKLASSSINGLTLGAGEIFSFNKVVGERSKKRGYKKAPIILHQQKEYDYGGGVCQLSTTIYQAAKAAGLEITEHHNHKKDVNYAKSGEDSAVDYGTLDLKFKNNTDAQIIIYSNVNEDSVDVQIYKKNS